MSKSVEERGLTRISFLCYYESNQKSEGLTDMKQVLLVIETEAFCQQLQKELQKDFDILVCHDAYTAADLIKQKPDGMILQINLPGTDGLTFLEGLSWKPDVILSLAVTYPPYTYQKLQDLGVGFFIRTPCAVRAVADRLRDMFKNRENSQDDAQKTAAKHLQRLGIPSADGGGKQLRVAIPLLAQDPKQKLSCELYPTVARICGSTSLAVERNISRTIQKAWSHREPASWEEYFPCRKRYPSNKDFLSTLAKKLY